MSLPPPYDRVSWRGVTMDNMTVAALTAVEDKLGRPIDTVYQGSYHPGTGASAGTHDLGGAIDCWDRDPEALCWCMRDVGHFASWIRKPSQGPWPYHCHGVLNGHQHMASLADSQVDMYIKGYNGLGWYAYKDDFGRRPSPITPFRYGTTSGDDDMDFNDKIPGAGDATVADALKAMLQAQRGLGDFRRNTRAVSAQDKQRDIAMLARLKHSSELVAAGFTEVLAEVEDDATQAKIIQVRDRLVTQIEALKPPREATETELPEAPA